MKLVNSALAASLLALQAGCPLVQVEAEVPEVCITYPDIEVDGSLASSNVNESFTFDDLARLHDLADLDAGISFTRAEVRVTSGVDSLAFVEQFRATVASGDPDSTLPTLVLFDCDGNCATAGATLSVPAKLVEDALAYVKTDSIVLDVSFAGQIPQTKFKLDVDVCMKGHASYTVDP
jgi:hypothetical protein